MVTIAALIGLVFLATLSAVGLVYYRITYVDGKGDITHSADGVLLFTDDGDFNPEGSDEMMGIISNKHAREGDARFRFRAYELDCEEE